LAYDSRQSSRRDRFRRGIATHSGKYGSCRARIQCVFSPGVVQEEKYCMHWVFQLSFVIVHLISYVVFFRRLRAFRREDAIFAFHMVAFVAVAVAAIAGWWLGAIGTATIAAILSLQLVYSMTFLETWSLAQGSYSLQILLQVARHPEPSKRFIIAATKSIGTQKKRNRLQSLIALGLLQPVDHDAVRLTRGGRCVITFFRAIKVLANIRAAG
jgi:hypothetical protein